MSTREIITKTIENATGEKDIHLEFPAQLEHGDFSTNVVMQLAKQSKGSPQEIAENLVVKMRKDKELAQIMSKVEVAEPGFINFWLSDEYLIKNLMQIVERKNDYGSSDMGKGKTVVIDYSSPNIAKRFSIGHLRSTIIGQALYNIYSHIGYKVIGDNHLGDWGTQFGVLIYMVEKNKLDPNSLSVDDWESLYVDFHNELESNPELKDEARSAFSRLEKGDKSARAIWQAAMDTSISEYNKVYKKLDVDIDYAYGESFYEDKMPVAIEKTKEDGVAVESEGALAVEFDKKYSLPSNILVKSNGATTYLARDLALMYFRKEKWNPDLQIFEVGSDQTLYFKQVFALAEMMNIFKVSQLKHIAHGMVRMPEGKMSTRKGKTIKLNEVLNRAVREAKKLGSETEKLAEQVGIGAIKYFDLKHNPTSEIVFDWDEILDLKGNSGPYLQYTYARTQSILRKVNSAAAASEEISFDDLEKEISRFLSRYPGVVVDAAKNYSPSAICNYLYQLAQKYNNFYNEERILGHENEQTRLLITRAVGEVIKNGLYLLGIEAPKKM